MSATAVFEMPAVDEVLLRPGPLERGRAQLVERDIAACVLLDPVNIRYATGARNIQVFHLPPPRCVRQS
jgi:Xaa-Pro dipeptidase